MERRWTLALLVVAALAVGAAEPDRDARLTWGDAVGGAGFDQALDVAVGADGGAVVVGRFSGTVDFDPGDASFLLTAAGPEDGFVAAYGRKGHLRWARAIGTEGRDDVTTVEVAPDGGIVLAGGFDGTMQLGDRTLTTTGNADVFVAAMSPDGEVQWAGRFGGDQFTDVADVAVHTDGTVAVVGGFRGTTDFDPGSDQSTLTSATSLRLDAYVVVLATNGALRWAGRLGGEESDEAHAVVFGADGSVLSVGRFAGTADFDPDPLPLVGERSMTAVGLWDGFVSKLDADGRFVWARQLGGEGGTTAYGAAVGTGGDLLVAGSFSTSLDADPGSGAHILTSSGLADAFVLSLSVDLGALNWATAVGGDRSDRARSVAASPSGGATAAGELGLDAFTVDVSGTGAVGTPRVIAGDGQEGVLAVRRAGHDVYLAGYFSRDADLDPGPRNRTVTSAGSWDGFVAVFAPPGPGCPPTERPCDLG